MTLTGTAESRLRFLGFGSGEAVSIRLILPSGALRPPDAYNPIIRRAMPLWNSQTARQEKQRNESTEKSSEPCEAEAAEQLRPRVGEKFTRAFEYVIEPGAHQPGNSRNADDQKAFIPLAGVAFDFLEQKPPAIEIGLQNVCRDEKSGSNHEPEGRNRKRA